MRTRFHGGRGRGTARARAGKSGTGTRRATGALVSSVRPSVPRRRRRGGEIAVGRMRREARRGRGGAAVAAWALAWTLAACFAGEAWGQSNCTTQVVDARSFDLGYGRRFDLTSKGGNVKYFIGFEELVEYTSTFWQTVLVNRECPAPPPPNPPPPNPPPPAQASVESNLQLSGTTAADFDAEAQDNFRGGVAL